MKVCDTNKCDHCNKQKCDCTSDISYTSPYDELAPIPTINTSTGAIMNVDDSMVIPESKEESFYIMQIFDIRGHDCLCFYDRGANQNLVDGELAERANLKVINPRSTPLGVVGGGRIWTEYGMYCLNIGPTESGHYHEVKCQGIKRITADFPTYELQTVNEEVKKLEKLPVETALPTYIGGSKVQLLLGIKDTALDPIQLFSLPCGLGVYQSELRDKFASRICYGGPHSLFSEVNQNVSGDFNHINVFFSRIASVYRDSIYPAICSEFEINLNEDDDVPIARPNNISNVYSVCVDRKERLELFPSPITEQDQQIFDPDIRPDYNKTILESCSSTHLCSVHKAKVPITKIVKIIDEDDISNLVNYRCPSCQQCTKCLDSNRTKTMSLQESIEQDIIHRSIQIDFDNSKVHVDYPFVKDPVPFLQKFHKGNNNYYQAKQAFIQQCRKPAKVKDGIRVAHKELVDKGFMILLNSLEPQQQNLINNHPFKHYYPWSSVVKESISTPVRLVVDPTRTGLNQILAKGENNMARIFDILVRNRCKRYIFTSDISKLYNQLYLTDAALPYSLFLFSEPLSVDHKPDVWVLLRAWYGVRSTGNQAGESLDMLAEHFKEEYPESQEVILRDRYVDDLYSGKNSKFERDTMIHHVESILKRGGFKLKYIAKSGEPPPSNSSTDGVSLKTLGYRWFSVNDQLSPGIGDVNLVPATNHVKVNIKMTRRHIIAKIAEFYDPIGIWEPLKLQLKLRAASMNGLEWDQELAEDEKKAWSDTLQIFPEIPSLRVDRCIVPRDAIQPESARLICLSDAATSAGGAAVYLGFRLENGLYSCQLLCSKSKLLDMSIPRNELSAILLMAELAFLVKKALGDIVSEALFFTDSTIALSWCHNVNKKLRMFVLNRVLSIRRHIEWITGESSDLPLYHIPGPENIADLLTKEHPITPRDLGLGSEWQSGKAWMQKEIADMPVTKYTDLSLSKVETGKLMSECFIELGDPQGRVKGIHTQLNNTNGDPQPHCPINHTYSHPLLSSYDPCGVDDNCINHNCMMSNKSVFLASKAPNIHCIDIIKLGWRKSVSIMAKVVKFCAILIHKSHSKSKHLNMQTLLQNNCKVCHFITNGTIGNIQRITREQKLEREKRFLRSDNWYLGENYWYRMASVELEGIMSKKTLNEEFEKKDGIYYFSGRLSEEFPVVSMDLDINAFFDNTDFNSILPVVHSSSKVYFAYVVYVHDTLRPHSGVELTYREISKKLHVIKNPRRIISMVRRDCTRCRIIFRKTLELEMANHGPHRTIMAPPFHAVQIDIVYKFKAKSWKNSRQVFDIYALVIVCLLSSATSILVLEGMTTTDVVQALERHSSKYGVPRHVYVDSGSQLIALQNVRFQIRDVNLHVWHALGMEVKVSNPKSHEERGRVEAKVKTLRLMLEKLSISKAKAMTTISWETLFARIANEVDNIPICKGNSSNVKDLGFDIITPNRLKLGRNNSRALDESYLLIPETEVELLDACRNYQKVWYQILVDRLHHLIPKSKKWQNTDSVETGDIVVFVHDDSHVPKHWTWFLGRVIGKQERKLIIEYFAGSKGEKTKMTVHRNPRQVAKIHEAKDIPVNTQEYYERNVKCL